MHQAALMMRRWPLFCHCIPKTESAITNGEFRSDTDILGR
ncbi:hypothetical protein BTN49_2751 [Candidatus Enterovibrio escicola]|uniref:Uncharacterized protein n=1 Tax=Candidatus Enterovibrio escicola TaxID=1927127 RepID=A0A2A5T0P0_9GAMM|nr:hypothetical protein BTN49_2751 [Candidatus Enterovibrio escacola]